MYLNEAAVGRSIANCGLPRGDLFVTSMVWVSQAGYESTRVALERSLELLDLDYLDVYLVHEPFGDYYGSWRAMEELAGAGLIRAIGVSNFYPDRLEDLVAHNEITPAVNQIETHPFCQRTTEQAHMAGLGVQLESWAPFAEANLGVLTHPTLETIARQHDRSVAQVVLRWLIQRGVVAIPKSVHGERIRQNFDVFGFTLSDAQMASIATLDRGESLFDHRDPASARACATWALEH